MKKATLNDLRARVRSLAIENKRLMLALEQSQAVACRDFLTGVYTRKEVMERGEYFMRTLNGHIEGNRRTPRPTMVELALCFVDINDLSVINDTYGHDAGDSAIAKITDCIKNHVRDTDVIGRTGGDEFLILFPNQTLAEVHLIVQKIKRAIEAQKVGVNGIHLGAAFGAASTSEGYLSLAELIKEADGRMYADKKNGNKA